MLPLHPTKLAARAQHALRRLRNEGPALIWDKCRQLRLASEWSALASARHYFEDKVGLEIGGPSSLFGRGSALPVYGLGRRFDNCNFAESTAWVQDQQSGETFVFDEFKRPGNQFFAEASSMDVVSDEAYDFAVSSHCLEHLANPLLALQEWRRVLKSGGALLLVLPHKDGTFDRLRPVTQLSHLIADYSHHTPETDLTHLDEVLRLHDLTRDPGSPDFETFKARCEANAIHRCIHHHVFNTPLAVELVDWADFQIVNVQLLRPFHIVVLAQKPRPDVPKNNMAFLPLDAGRTWRSPFPSDQRTYRCGESPSGRGLTFAPLARS